MLQADQPPDIQRLYAESAWEIVADPVELPSPESFRGGGSLRFGSTAGYLFDQLQYRDVAAASTTAPRLHTPPGFSTMVSYVPSSGWCDASLTRASTVLLRQTSTGGWVTI